MPTVRISVGSRNWWLRTLQLVLICVISVCGTVIVLSVSHFRPSPASIVAQPAARSTGKKPEPRKALSGIPSRLKISAIGVNAIVNMAGLTADGAMDIDDDPDSVAWYVGGPRPGDPGSAVIAGHYGWLNNHASIFTELHTLKQGDKVTVQDDKDISSTFIVREIRKYDPAADSTGVFNSSDGQAHLNLITCDGSWNNTEQTYSMRLVVFTDREA